MDQVRIERIMRDAANACGATVLEITLHSFGEDSGITGVAILAESHISIHTWPEIDYVALDIFVCGVCDPYRAVPPLRALFEPRKEHIREFFGEKSMAKRSVRDFGNITLCPSDQRAFAVTTSTFLSP